MERRDGDYMNDLIKYIENNLKSGYREDQLRFLLLNQGYSRSAVDKAFRIAEQNRPKEHFKSIESPRVEVFDREAEQPKRKSLFSRLFGGMFSKKQPKAGHKAPSPYAGSDFVQVDSGGNVKK